MISLRYKTIFLFIIFLGIFAISFLITTEAALAAGGAVDECPTNGVCTSSGKFCSRINDQNRIINVPNSCQCQVSPGQTPSQYYCNANQQVCNVDGDENYGTYAEYGGEQNNTRWGINQAAPNHCICSNIGVCYEEDYGCVADGSYRWGIRSFDDGCLCAPDSCLSCHRQCSSNGRSISEGPTLCTEMCIFIEGQYTLAQDADFWIEGVGKIQATTDNQGLLIVKDSAYGDTYPAEILEVRDNLGGGSTARIRITDEAENPELQLQYSAVANEHWAIYADNSDDSFRIWGVGDSGDNRLVIDSSGNVGLGYDTPFEKLSVDGNIISSGNIQGNFVDYDGTTCADTEILKYDVANGWICAADVGGASKWSDGAEGNEIYYSLDNVGIGTNNPAQILEVNDSANPSIVRITDTTQNPELQLQYGVDNDHWAIYAANDDADKFKVWGGADHLVIDLSGNANIGNDLTIGNNFNLGGTEINALGDNLYINSYGDVQIRVDADNNGSNSFSINNGDNNTIFNVNESGDTAIEGNVTIEGNITVNGGSSNVLTLPTEIKETGAAHSADFTDLAASGWEGLSTFVTNQCGADYHPCYSWEMVYIYTNGLSTDNCDTQVFDDANSCLGWVASSVSELGPGDCDGYTNDTAGVWHSSIWYVDQWGAAECSDELPVLCCK